MENTNKKKSKKSGIVTAAFFVFSLVIVGIIAIVEFGGERDRSISTDAFHYPFLLCAIGCFLLALACESFKYSYLLYEKGYRNKKSLGFQVAVIGKYYDNLTPAGAGGQGFQIYQLTKNGCGPGTAGGLPMIGLIGLQFAFVLIAIVSMILGQAYLEDLVVIKVTAIIGVIFYAFVPAAIVFFAIAPNVLIGIVNWGTKFLGKIKLIKNPEKASQKAIDSLQSYTGTLRAFGRSSRQILVVGVTSLIYQAAFMSLPYFILRFFGADVGFWESFCRVVYIYAASTIIFTPGNSGAAEASFYMVFSQLSGGAIFWGMLVWRGLCYYSWIIVGAAVQIRERLQAKKNHSSEDAMPFIPDQPDLLGSVRGSEKEERRK